MTQEEALKIFRESGALLEGHFVLRSGLHSRQFFQCAIALQQMPVVEQLGAELANRVRDLNKIQSEAYRQVEEIRGMADAKATEIYARAYNQSPEAVAFYEFTRTMQSYKSIIAENTTLVLSTDSDLFKFLKGMTPNGDVIPDSRQKLD